MAGGSSTSPHRPADEPMNPMMRLVMRRRGGGMWWLLLLGPTGLGAILVLVLLVTLIGGASSTAANDQSNSDSSGSLCTFNGTSPVAGSATSGAAASGPAAAVGSQAALSAAVAQATASLPQSELTAAEHIAGVDLPAEQIRGAQIIVGVGKGLHVDHRGMQVAVLIAQTDSGLNPAASLFSGAVVGMFHQITDAYPGVKLSDPVASTVAFYGRLTQLSEYITPSTDVGQVAAAMQKQLTRFNLGATAGVYATHDGWAKALVQLLDTGPAAPAAGAGKPAFDCLTGLVAVAIPGLTPAQAHNAQVIAAVGAARKLPTQAIAIAVAVAIAESTLLNFANDGTSADYGYFAEGHRQLNGQERATAAQSLHFPHDAVGHNLDSEGLFQQRPSAGWGTSAQLMNPATSAGKFYDQLVKISGYATGDPATIAQKVQGSNDSSGGIYASSYTQATAIVAALAKAPTGPPGGAAPGGKGVVLVNGPKITLPAAAGIAGTITAPNATVAKAITAGLNWLGEPYSWAGGSPAGPTLGVCSPGLGQNDCNIVGFDCSGLMLYMWAQVGITMPRNSQDQWAAGTQIPYSQAQAGDMIGYPGHIAMFIGNFGGVDYELEAPRIRTTPPCPASGPATDERTWRPSPAPFDERLPHHD